MRIAHIGSKGIPSRGGTERVVEAIAARQSRLHQVTVYGSRLVCGDGVCRGARVLAVPTRPWKHAGPVLLQLQSAVHAALCGDYDVVHVHGSENAFVLPLLKTRYPTVLTTHMPPYWRDKWSPAAKAAMRAVERWSVSMPDVSTSVSARQAGLLRARYGAAVEYVPNGVDPDDAIDQPAARRILSSLDVEPGQYILFAAARVDPTKGCHSLLRVAASLAETPPILVVGDLRHAPGYEAELRALAAGKAVHFVPRVEEKPVLLGLLTLARLFVFPSLAEGMSMMLLEALSTGVPTLPSDIPENTAVLPPGFGVFAAGDEDSLAAALGRTLAQPREDLVAQCDLGRRWVRERFAWDRIAQQYETLYRRAVSRRAQNRSKDRSDTR